MTVAPDALSPENALNWKNDKLEVRSTYVSAEHHCRHIVYNKSGVVVRHFHIDDDMIPGGTSDERCDYLLLDDTRKNAYYIELKGSPSNTKKCLRQVKNVEALLSPLLQGYQSLYRFVYKPTHGHGKALNQKGHYGGTEQEIINLMHKKKLIAQRSPVEEYI